MISQFCLACPHRPEIHRGHARRSQRCVFRGFVLISHCMSSSLHSTERKFTPEPQVTEHYQRRETIVLKQFTRLNLSRILQNSLNISPIRPLTLPHSPVIHVGHGLMLQASLADGLALSSHPGLNFPVFSLHSTLRCLVPSPQETEHQRKRNTSTLVKSTNGKEGK